MTTQIYKKCTDSIEIFKKYSYHALVLRKEEIQRNVMVQNNGSDHHSDWDQMEQNAFHLRNGLERTDASLSWIDNCLVRKDDCLGQIGGYSVLGMKGDRPGFVDEHRTQNFQEHRKNVKMRELEL